MCKQTANYGFSKCSQAHIVIPLIQSHIYLKYKPQPILACQQLPVSHSIIMPSPVTYKAIRCPITFLNIPQFFHSFVVPVPIHLKPVGAIKQQWSCEEKTSVYCLCAVFSWVCLKRQILMQMMTFCTNSVTQRLYFLDSLLTARELLRPACKVSF